MKSVLALAKEQLDEAGYSTALEDSQDNEVLLFENDTILGFVLCFPDASAVLQTWQSRSQHVLKSAQFALRRAERKAWNSYLVFLAEAAADYGESIMLGSIEEDLVGTRKIAKAGMLTAEDTRLAILPLLAIQNAPHLEAVDMAAEIRLRTTELPAELVDAFLGGAAETSLAQLLENSQ
jgi:hypothetical protein